VSKREITSIGDFEKRDKDDEGQKIRKTTYFSKVRPFENQNLQ
jgi:hypothetical protein